VERGWIAFYTSRGEANDYVWQGHGGRARSFLKPSPRSTFTARDTIIMGNTCLYGATGGELYARGPPPANDLPCAISGALAVVERRGGSLLRIYDRPAWYACLRAAPGVNFGAGLTGGFAVRARYGGGISSTATIMN